MGEVRLTFYGAAGTVTGSCFLLDAGRTRLLVDCGLFQGDREIKERNYGEFPFDPRSVDFVVLTHAHLDHCGLLPKLYKKGFRGPVFATPGTRDLARVVLLDSANIQESEVERKNRKLRRAGKEVLEPIYTVDDAHECLKMFEAVDYGEMVGLSPDVAVRLNDAGHILGSASVETWLSSGEDGLKVVFSGDIGQDNQPIVNDPEEIAAADCLVLEATYGDEVRRHGLKADSRARAEGLLNIIRSTVEAGGNVIIPAFAVERTQDLLHALTILALEGKLAGVRLILDSPMAAAATEVFCSHPEYFDDETRSLGAKLGSCPFHVPGLEISRTQEDSRRINEIRSGAVIIAGSGMCDAGRIKHHLKHNLWREECTIVFVGYQAAGTLGRRILQGEKMVRIHGEEIAVKARIVNLPWFSAHADQAQLVKWTAAFERGPGVVYLVHGEEGSLSALASALSPVAAARGATVVVPSYLQTETLRTFGKVFRKAPDAATG